MPAADKKLFIVKIGDSGSSLTLNDGTRWKISESDKKISACWEVNMHVLLIEDQRDRLHPYLLTNLDTSKPDAVKARPKIS